MLQSRTKTPARQDPGPSANEQQPLAALRLFRVVIVAGPALAAPLQPQRLFGRRRTLHGAEAVMVDQPDRLDRVRRRDDPVVEGNEIVAVLLLAPGGEVRRPRKHDRVRLVEVDDDKLVVDYLSRAAAPLPPERSRDVVCEIRKRDEGRIGTTGRGYLERSVQALRR